MQCGYTKVKLKEYLNLLEINFNSVFSGLIHNLEEKIQPLIVPAILEHEEVPGMSGKPSGMRSRMGSISSPVKDQKPTTSLIHELTNHHKVKFFKQYFNTIAIVSIFIRCESHKNFLAIF